MEKIDIGDLLSIHSYLSKLSNPSAKMKEALEKVEEHLHGILTSMKKARFD